ncbi:MAG: helix-turn-helix domain-containing protein [Verrucomicrobiota bacterium]
MDGKKLPTRLRAAREKAALSQSQFAKKYDLSIHTLQSWEQGKYVPRGLAAKELDRILSRILKD